MFAIPPFCNGHSLPRLLVVAERPADLVKLIRLLGDDGYPVVGAALAGAGEAMACDYVYDLLVISMPPEQADCFLASVRHRRPLICALIVDATIPLCGPPPADPRPGRTGATDGREMAPAPAGDPFVAMLGWARVASPPTARRWPN